MSKQKKARPTTEGNSELLRVVRRSALDRGHYLRIDSSGEIPALCGTKPLDRWNKVGRVPTKVCMSCVAVANALRLRLDGSYESPPRRTAQSHASERTGDLFSGEVPVLVATRPKVRKTANG